MGYTNLTSTIAEGKIANALKSTAADHVVAKAENIYDTSLKGYQSEINDNLTNKFNDYLLLSGGTLTGDLTIKGDSSGTNDTYEDWKISNVKGYFKIQNRNSGNTWVDVLSLAPSTTKTLTSSYSVLPTTNTLDLGSPSMKWRNVYGNYFSGTSENTNNIGDLKYFKYFMPDNGGRDSYVLIAKMSDWVEGTHSNYCLVGTIYGQRSGNQARTQVFNIIAQATSYPNKRQSILNVSNHYATGRVVPCIVEYTDENKETCNYLALKKTGSGGDIYFVGLMESLLPQSDWILLNVSLDPEQKFELKIIEDVQYTNTYPITTNTYYDGSTDRILLHSGNYSQYANKYELLAATNSALGGIQIGYKQSGQNYPVQLANNKAYVNVPWTDTQYTLQAASDSALGGIQIGYKQSGQNYPVQLANNKAYVNVPWTDTQYTLQAASDSVLGGIKTGYTQSGKNYPVQLDSNNNAYVNVPWTDNDTNTKVTQTVTTVNANYPLLLAPAGQTATTTEQSYFDSGVTLNPSNNILSGAKVYESLLQWGNTAIAGSLSPLDVAMDGQWSTNRLSFMPADDINIEYSTNSGSSWTDYGLTASEKQAFVTTGLGYSLYPGKNTTRQKIESDRVRITITATQGKTYFSLKKIYIFMSQQGAADCKVKVEKLQIGSTEFVEVGEYGIAGWSGWSSIPLTANFGGNNDQTTNVRKLRFTYYFKQYNQGLNYGETNDKSAVKSYISKLNMIGETSWTNSGGSLAETGHLYSWDVNKNATFPADLTVKGNTTLGDTTTNTITIKGKTTIEAGAGLVLKGSSDKNPLITRSIKGSDGSGQIGPLYIQYGANQPTYLGNAGSYTISADGSQYSGNALTATTAAEAVDIKSTNIATESEITALFNN